MVQQNRTDINQPRRECVFVKNEFPIKIRLDDREFEIVNVQVEKLLVSLTETGDR